MQVKVNTAAFKSREFRGVPARTFRGIGREPDTAADADAFCLGLISIQLRFRIRLITASEDSPRFIKVLIFCSSLDQALSRVFPYLHFLAKFKYHFGPLFANGACKSVTK